MPKTKPKKKPKNYSKKKFLSLTLAYNTYKKQRQLASPNAVVAPKDKFARIWGWK